MKRFPTPLQRLFAVVVVLSLLLPSSLPARSAEENLLSDGSFDNGMTVMSDANSPSIGFWTSMSWASAINEPANAHTGSGLAHLVFSADGLAAGEFPTIYQDVEVQTNSTYRVSFYAKCWNINATTQPLYYGYRNALRDVWTPVMQEQTSSLSNEYQKISFEFDTGDLTRVRLFAFTTSSAGGLGGYHLDDFEIVYLGSSGGGTEPIPTGTIPPEPTEPAENPDNLIKNASFANSMTVMSDANASSVGFWTSMSWASAIQEPVNAHAGSGLANLVFSADGLPTGEFPTIYQDVEVQANSIYRVSFYAKCWNINATTQPLYYGYRNALQDVWTPVMQEQTSSLSNEYQKISFEFDTGDLTRVRIFAFTTSSAGGAGGYHLDDFEMVYVGEGEQIPEMDESGSLLKDGSFQTDMTVITDGNASSVGFWTSMSWASTVYERVNALYGKSLANLVYSADGLAAGEFPTIYQDVNVRKDSLYRVTFYAKQWGDSDQKGTLYYGWRNALKNVWIPIRQFEAKDVGDGYQKISFLVETRSCSRVRIFAFTESITAQGIGGYHLDGFKMEYVGAHTNSKPTPIGDDVDRENLLNDPSFESGDIQRMPLADPAAFCNQWTMMSVAGVDANYDFARSGKSNLFMAYSAEGMPAGDYPTVWQDVTVEPNTWYEMSFYIKQWGVDAEDDRLYFGYRDPNAANIWINVAERIQSDFSDTYQRVTFRFQSGDRDVLRIFFCIVASDYEKTGGAGGYHIDDVRLYRLSDVTGATLEISDDVILGKRVEYTASGDFANGKKDVPVTLGNGMQISFESSDPSVVLGDLQGNLLAVGVGTAQVRLVLQVNHSRAVSDPVQVTVTQNSDGLYISSVTASVEGTLRTGTYAPIVYQMKKSDGTTLPAGACTITLRSSDETVVWVKQHNDGYLLYGVGQGEADVYVTAESDGMLGITKLRISIDDGNVLRDSSFELQNQSTAYWTVQGNAAYGVDAGAANKLSRTGEANLWMAAPVFWTADVVPGSELMVSQTVALDPGAYTMTAFINRFYATGTTGILPELGGEVRLGLIPAAGGQGQEASFDVTYGVGGYQALNGYFTVETAGQYTVYVHIVGDPEFGLGMQLEDVSLCPTQFPETVTASIASTQAGELAEILLVANYADGTQAEITRGVTCAVENTGIAQPAGRWLVCRSEGQTEVTVTVTIAGRDYTAKTMLTVLPGASEQAPEKQPDGADRNGDDFDNLVWVIWAAVAGVAILCGAAAFLVAWKRKKTRG